MPTMCTLTCDCGGVTAIIILTKDIYVGTKSEIVQRFISSIFGLLEAATLRLYTYSSKCLCRLTFTRLVARFLLYFIKMLLYKGCNNFISPGLLKAWGTSCFRSFPLSRSSNNTEYRAEINAEIYSSQ